MAYALFVLFFGMQSAPYFDGGTYASAAECNKAMEAILPRIAEYNSKAENAKNQVVSYALACVPVKKAPPGIGV